MRTRYQKINVIRVNNYNETGQLNAELEKIGKNIIRVEPLYYNNDLTAYLRVYWVNVDINNKAIEFIKSTCVKDSKGSPAMLMGDVYELVKILTRE